MVGHFVTIPKPDLKSVRKMAIPKPEGPVFGRSLYLNGLFVSSSENGPVFKW
jgi:hypothetical protein